MRDGLFLWEKQGQNGGENSADAQGDGTHGALKLSDLSGLGSAEGMAGNSNGHSLRHRVRDVKDFGKQGSEQRPGDARYNDGGYGDALNAAAAVRNGHGDGGGDAFGQKRGGDAALHRHGLAQQQDGAHAGETPHQTTDHDDAGCQPRHACARLIGLRQKARAHDEGGVVGHHAQKIYERDADEGKRKKVAKSWLPIL